MKPKLDAALPWTPAARIGNVLCAVLIGSCATIEHSPGPVTPPVPEPSRAAIPIAPAAVPSVPQPAPTQPAKTPPEAVSAAPAAAPPAKVDAGGVRREAVKPPAPPPKRPVKAARAPSPAAPSPSLTVPPPAPTVPPPAPAVPPPAPAITSRSATAKPPPKESADPVAAAPKAAPPLDLDALETRLKETKAIGLFTKLTLKNQIDDLLDRFRAFHQGRLEASLAELRQSFDRLVLKVLALLQDSDPPLAGAIVSSRESIWAILSNPARFAAT